MAPTSLSTASVRPTSSRSCRAPPARTDGAWLPPSAKTAAWVPPSLASPRDRSERLIRHTASGASRQGRAGATSRGRNVPRKQGASDGKGIDAGPGEPHVDHDRAALLAHGDRPLCRRALTRDRPQTPRRTRSPPSSQGESAVDAQGAPSTRTSARTSTATFSVSHKRPSSPTMRRPRLPDKGPSTDPRFPLRRPRAGGVQRLSTG